MLGDAASAPEHPPPSHRPKRASSRRRNHHPQGDRGVRPALATTLLESSFPKNDRLTLGTRASRTKSATFCRQQYPVWARPRGELGRLAGAPPPRRSLG